MASAKERFQQLAAQEEEAKRREQADLARKEEEKRKKEEERKLAAGGKTKIGTTKGQIRAFATGTMVFVSVFYLFLFVIFFIFDKSISLIKYLYYFSI